MAPDGLIEGLARGAQARAHRVDVLAERRRDLADAEVLVLGEHEDHALVVVELPEHALEQPHPLRAPGTLVRTVRVVDGEGVGILWVTDALAARRPPRMLGDV